MGGASLGLLNGDRECPESLRLRAPLPVARLLLLGALLAPRSLLAAEEPDPEGPPDAASIAEGPVPGDSSTGHTADPAPPASEPGFTLDKLKPFAPETHGFVSQGFMWSNQNNYLARTVGGTFEFAEVGINFTSQLSDKLRVGVQLFMRDVGETGNYRPQFDWFYLDYRFFDWLGLRAGRSKIPFGLYNEIHDVDAARVPILLPQSLYPEGNRDYLLAQTGVSLYGVIPLSALGSLHYDAYGGTIYLDITPTNAITDFHVPYVVGGRLMWQTPLDGLQAGATVQALSLNGTAHFSPEQVEDLIDSGTVQEDFSGTVPFRIPALLWVSSLEYANRGLLLAAEYSRWILRVESEPPGAYSQPEAVQERMYAMASYQVAPWFTPGAYYSFMAPRLDARTGHGTKQHDVALTVRSDITNNWLLKLEGHIMRGTADLDPALNAGQARGALQRDWLLLLAKTTAYF